MKENGSLLYLHNLLEASDQYVSKCSGGSHLLLYIDWLISVRSKNKIKLRIYLGKLKVVRVRETDLLKMTLTINSTSYTNNLSIASTRIYCRACVFFVNARGIFSICEHLFMDEASLTNKTKARETRESQCVVKRKLFDYRSFCEVKGTC